MFSPGSRLRLSKFEFLRPLENSQEILRGTAGRADLGTATKPPVRLFRSAAPPRPPSPSCWRNRIREHRAREKYNVGNDGVRSHRWNATDQSATSWHSSNMIERHNRLTLRLGSLKTAYDPSRNSAGCDLISHDPGLSSRSDRAMSVEIVRVFTHQGLGGNPCPIVCSADGMTDAQMQSVARDHGLESGFVLSSRSGEFDYRFRYWVPNHEMEMCGHATIGALWLLSMKKAVTSDQVRIRTLSGPIMGFVGSEADGSPAIEITQPAGAVRTLSETASEAVWKVLRIHRSDLLDLPIQNAATSRVKTVIPIRDVDRLNDLKPDFAQIEALCNEIGSTGLYPYAQHDDATQLFDARQFPRSSGYPEDAATGIAATALSFSLLSNDLVERSSKPIRIMQGRAMGRLSQIQVRLGFAGDRTIGCTVRGAVSQS
jgi:PhzF family phenazine biosynthesis protein